MLFLLGVIKKSLMFSIIGSLLLMIFSLVCVIIGIMGSGIQMTHLNVTNGTGAVNTYNITIDKDKSIGETITLSYGIVSFIFSSLLLLYTVWSQKHRETGKEDD
jgi:hypothetical protein